MITREQWNDKIRAMYKAIIDCAIENDLIIVGKLEVYLVGEPQTHTTVHIRPKDN